MVLDRSINPLVYRMLERIMNVLASKYAGAEILLTMMRATDP